MSGDLQTAAEAVMESFDDEETTGDSALDNLINLALGHKCHGLALVGDGGTRLSQVVIERDVARGKVNELRQLLEDWVMGGQPMVATQLALTDCEIGDLARAAAAQRAPHAEGCDALSGNRCSCGLVP